MKTHRVPLNAEKVKATLLISEEIAEKIRETDPTLDDYFRRLYKKQEPSAKDKWQESYI